MLESLNPTERLRVYDLVREAGLDVSDWSNYKQPDSPQSNPKYCYEWAFSGKDRIVVCLWFGDMREEGSRIFQTVNYTEIPDQPQEASSVRKRRGLSMKRSLQKALLKQLPVRVIIVHDPDNKSANREVKLRSLDPESWHVVSYDDDTGECVLQRGSNVVVPRVSMLRFRAELENLRSHLLEFDGYPFTSFTCGKIYDWENYKEYVFAEAGRRLNWQKWRSEEVGTGVILDRVIHAVEIDDGPHKRNNLLKWQQYGVHNILAETRVSTRCFELESLL